ncbi:MAG: sensor histidine kinase, partial [Planctomycetia bacterium]
YQAGLAIEDNRFYHAMMQAERLAAIGQTIATLSHHIKNILQGVRSGSYLIDLGIKDKKLDVLEQGWGIVQKNQDKIYNLVMDMLSISKERQPALEPADLNAVAADVVELMAPRAKERNVELTLRKADEMPETMLDAEGIHRALLNIVTNAIDAVDGCDAPRVLVETSFDLERQIVKAAVADNGCGIAEDQHEKLFQIFHSTKGARGSGLGLAVTKKIVQEHGGSVRVKSRPNEGSRFTIELPLKKYDKPTVEDSDADFKAFKAQLAEDAEKADLEDAVE